MIDMVFVVLQNCMDLLKVEPGSDSETCHDGNQVIDIKVEEVTDIQEEEDPLRRTFTVIKTEHEVSCISVYIVIFISQIFGSDYSLCHQAQSVHVKHVIPNTLCLLLIFVCLSMNITEVHSS
jgi:hypothetical protein